MDYFIGGFMENKFYKVLNERMNMKDFQYHIGLNYDDSGLYFADGKNICSYLSYGDKIATILIPEDAHVVKMERQLKSDKIIVEEIYDLDDINTWKMLLSDKVDIHTEFDYALRWNAKIGNLGVVKFLVESGADIHAGNDLALKFAKEENHNEVADYLQSIL